jgi:pimeloyl-ACP methyl ester carboxylesterase
MATLDGSPTTLELAPGVRLRAPGLRGSVELRESRTPGTRGGGDELATPALDDALTSSELNEVQSIVIEAAHVPVPENQQVRTAGGEEGLVLEVPDLGETVGQVVMAIDEDGTISWHFPQDQTGGLETPASRGAGATKTFVIRSTTPTSTETDPGTRSLAFGIGKKVLKVLVYPVADTVLQTAARFFARKWEEKHRPYGIRWFRPDDYHEVTGTPVAPTDWSTLSEGRSLLFVHGTFSRSFSGFWGIPPETMAELHRMYNGRVFAYDHFTLSHDPERNVVEFLDRMPDAANLKVDLISHSRGGLVSRALSGETALGRVPRISVGKAVFVAAPNHGTPLADNVHMMEFIDRYTSMLNLVPPGPHAVVTDILEAIVTVVKMIGNSALEGLPGLAAMDPTGPFLASMNQGAATSAQYFGIASNYEPGGGLAAMVKDGLIDRVFGDAANDLVVPTVGVYSGSDDPAFPIPSDRVLEFDTSRAISHSDYFSRAETSAALLGWLGEGE